MTEKEVNHRHPYTYSCDYIRGLAGYSENGTKLSRSDASLIRQGIALALGISDEQLATKLSEHFQANEDALAEKSTNEFIATLNF